MSIVAAFMVPHPPMIVPEIGGGSEKQIEDTTAAYESVARQIASLKPETILISSPHATMYADYFHVSPRSEAEGSFAAFRASGVSFREQYDTELVSTLEDLAAEEDFPAGTLGEQDAKLDHGTMVPLYFIRKYYRDFRIVRIGLSGLPLTEHYHAGQLLQKAVQQLGRRTVYVASGDLSHKLQTYGPYGFAEEGPAYDERIMEVCGSGRFKELFSFKEDFCEKAAECGHRSFVMMAGALDGLSLEIQKLSHQDVTGVGYGICSFLVKGLDENRRFLDQYEEEQKEQLQEKRERSDAFVRLAYYTLESYIGKHLIPETGEALNAIGGQETESGKGKQALGDLMTKQAGAFVSIHKDGALRGCIGTFLPTQDNLAQEIIQNAVSASTRDPRFSAITEKELPFLDISVDVLGTPEDITSQEELDPKRYGVIVTSGRKRGLLLPDLEGVDTVSQQIAIAKRKAGIYDYEKVSLQRFEVVRHS